MINIYYRKLYEPAMIARWNACQFTSFHRHGEPVAWADLRGQGVVDKAQYMLDGFYGRGRYLTVRLPVGVAISFCRGSDSTPGRVTGSTD